MLIWRILAALAMGACSFLALSKAGHLGLSGGAGFGFALGQGVLLPLFLAAVIQKIRKADTGFATVLFFSAVLAAVFLTLSIVQLLHDAERQAEAGEEQVVEDPSFDCMVRVMDVLRQRTAIGRDGAKRLVRTLQGIDVSQCPEPFVERLETLTFDIESLTLPKDEQPWDGKENLKRSTQDLEQYARDAGVI